MIQGDHGISYNRLSANLDLTSHRHFRLASSSVTHLQDEAEVSLSIIRSWDFSMGPGGNRP